MSEQPTEILPPEPSRRINILQGQVEINPETSPYPQIADFARAHGREIDDGLNLDGLSWREGKLWKKEVSSHLHSSRKGDYTIQHYHSIPIWSRRHQDPKHKWVTQRTTAIKNRKPNDSFSIKTNIVKTRNEYDDVVSIDTLTDEQLQQYFHRATRADVDNIDDVHLPDLNPEHEASDYVIIPVTLEEPAGEETEAEKTESEEAKARLVVFQQLDEQRWQNGLPNWDGFTWQAGRGDDQTTYTIRENETVITTDKHGNREPPKRVFILESTHPHGSPEWQTWEMLDVGGLQGKLAELPKLLRHLEIAGTPPEARPHFAVLKDGNPTPARAAENRPAFSLEQAKRELGFEDLQAPSDKTRAELQQLQNGPNLEKAAVVLERLVSTVGYPKVSAFAKQYADYMRRLGSKQTDEKGQSASAALWGLLQFQLISPVGEDSRGIFAEGSEGIKAQHQALTYIVARQFANVALQLKQVAETGEPRVVDDKIVQPQTLKTVLRLDPNLLDKFAPPRLAPYIRNQVLDALADIIAHSEKGAPGALDKDYLNLGNWLIMSVR